MAKKKIIVIPFGGLGNRMRVLSSCIQIAKRDDRKLWVVWPKNSDLGCDITDIFESVGIEYSIPPRWIFYLLNKIYRPASINRFQRFYKLLSKIFFDDSIFDHDVHKNKNQLNINGNHSSLLVASCLAFGDPDFNYFKFTNDLKDQVEREYKKIGKSYVGIHIRRTDHVNTIKYSPDQNYLDQIDKCIVENPLQIFFLATDDEKTKKYFKEKYNGGIYTLDHKLGRGDLEGIYGAIIELLLLSKSIKIICSIISSYSTAAILIGNIKEVVFVDTFITKEHALKKGKFPREYMNL